MCAPLPDGRAVPLPACWPGCHRGLVIGWDRQCLESPEWAEDAGVAQLKRGALQPFYHVSQERGEGGAGGAWAPAGDQGLRERGGEG